MLFRRTVQLPVRGKHWAEVASGSAEPGAGQATNTSRVAVASGITHSAAQFSRGVLSQPRATRSQPIDMINARRISIFAIAIKHSSSVKALEIELIFWLRLDRHFL